MRRLTYVTFTPQQMGGGCVMLCLLYYIILCYTITRWICWRNSKCNVLCYTVSHWIYWNVLCYVILYRNSLKSLHAFSYYKTCGLKLRLIHKQSTCARVHKGKFCRHAAIAVCSLQFAAPWSCRPACRPTEAQGFKPQGFRCAAQQMKLQASSRTQPWASQLPASCFGLAAQPKQPNKF